MPIFDDPTSLFDDPNFLFGGSIGDLITADYQFEYNALLMGPGTNYRLRSIEGLAQPDVRTSDVDRPRDHGQLAGQDFLTGRDIILDIIVKGSSPSSLYANVDALATATEPAANPVPLVFQLPGQQKKRVVVRPRKRHSVASYGDAPGNIQEFTIQFHAVDPRLYDNALTSTPLTLPASSGGLGWPVGWPLAWGSASGGPIVVTNAGGFPTRPLVTFLGPLSSPFVSNATAGQTWRCLLDLQVGDQLAVDFDYRTVLLNSSASRYSFVTSDSEWWELAPGNSTVLIGALTGSGSATLAYRSAWL